MECIPNSSTVHHQEKKKRKKKEPRDKLTVSVTFKRNSQICETGSGPPVGQWMVLIMLPTKNGMVEQKMGKHHPPLTKSI